MEGLGWFVTEAVPKEVSDKVLHRWLVHMTREIVAQFKRVGCDVSKAQWQVLEDTARSGLRITWLYAYAPMGREG